MANTPKDKALIALGKVMHGLFRLLPLKDRVVFSSFGGTEYNDNPRAISEALRRVSPGTEQVWMLPDNYPEEVPSDVKRAPRMSVKAMYYYATSRVLVDNFSIPQWFIKREGQKYIQTWHGDRGFKKILYDSSFISKTFYRPEQDICDLMTAGSVRGEDKLRSAFRYKGEILRSGSPRNDLLIRPDPALAEKIRRRYDVAAGRRVVLYAPTFHRNENKGFEIKGLDLPGLLDGLQKITGEEWVCFLRAHKASHGFKAFGTDPRLVDVTGYPDMNELMLAADCLITDYSSSAGDFALTGRPIILFREDNAEYTNRDRTFYFDIAETPFKVAEDQQAILDRFEELRGSAAKENDDKILEFYGCCETGHASQDCARWIEKNLN